MTARKFRIVPADEGAPERALSALVPELLAAERKVAALRNQVDAERRRLAAKRGVAFLRPEAVRREFAA